MVVDTSALLAVLFDEDSGNWVIDRFEEHRPRLRMSVLNYTESLIRAASKFPGRLAAVESRLQISGIALRPITRRHAELAAVARLRFPLNLGDCFAYEVAQEHACRLLYVGDDFSRTDIEGVRLT